MWGIIPAAGCGSRIQPLAFSKELLPVGSRLTDGGERPCAVSEYLCERMIAGGADKLCFVIAPGKSDIMEYFGAEYAGASIAYVVQPEPVGLCDAIFRVASLITPNEHLVVGLPDTIWMPADGYRALPDGMLSFLLFPVANPSAFDAVATGEAGDVTEIQVKYERPVTEWVWGGFKMPGRILHQLQTLWQERGRADEYMGTLVNAYLARGGRAEGIKAGSAYVDVGTLEGYRSANELLSHSAGSDERAGMHVTAGAPVGRQFLAHRRELVTSFKHVERGT